jgi:pimeloyl-ACP methyl ester carboxylesterase
MEKLIRLIIMVGMIAASLGMLPRAHAQSTWPPICQESSLPSHDPLYPNDQLIITCIPPNWNGQLVMYAHGYVPEQAPLALPVTELFLPDGTFVPDLVLMQGYAFATTSYHKNGYAVEQARRDLNDLINYFKTLVPGSLQKVFLIGASEGGEIAALMIEHFPDKYAGALALCGPIGGGPYQVQYLSDFRAVFDYFFPEVFTFGVADVPEDAYLNWGIYTQSIAAALTADPAAAAQLYNVSGAALDPMDPSTLVGTAVSVLFYSIWGTNDLIDTAGGMPYDNQLTVYTGSLNDALLNAEIERVQSDGRARAYMRRFYQTTGELQRPLVTLHTTLDPVVPFLHEQIYSSLAAATGDSSFLTVIPVPRYGHCNFHIEEIAGAFNLLVQQASAQEASQNKQDGAPSWLFLPLARK